MWHTYIQYVNGVQYTVYFWFYAERLKFIHAKKGDKNSDKHAHNKDADISWLTGRRTLLPSFPASTEALAGHGAGSKPSA